MLLGARMLPGDINTMNKKNATMEKEEGKKELSGDRLEW